MINMKTAKTMIAKAKALAIEKGIRVVQYQGNTIVGYALTDSELSAIYSFEGFLPKTQERHIKDACTIGICVRIGKLIYFVVGPEDAVALSDLSEEQRMRELKSEYGCRYIRVEVAA